MIKVEDQLTAYGELLRQLESPIRSDEVLTEESLIPTPQQPSRQTRGIWVAVAAAVLVLLIGIIPLLLRTGEGSPAVTQVPTTLTEVTPTTDVASTTAVTEPPPTTSAPATGAAEPEGVFGFPPGIPILDMTGFDMTDTLIFIDEYIGAIGEGTAEPLFDTGTLGTEVVLSPVEGLDFEGGSTPSPDNERPSEQLALFTVGVEGTDHVGQFGAFLEYATDSEAQEFGFEFVNFEYGFNVLPGGGEGRSDRPPAESLGLLMVSDPGNGDLTGIAGLPPEAAVVSTVYGDGTLVWQRPLFGMALFNNTTRECLPEPAEGQGCAPMELIVLDATGSETFRIVTPVSDPSGRYMIVTPDGETYLR